jgi:hypothetical protein
MKMHGKHSIKYVNSCLFLGEGFFDGKIIYSNAHRPYSEIPTVTHKKNRLLLIKVT